MTMNLKHRLISNTALPYITNLSPTDPTPRYVGGSNVLTSIKGIVERRPAYATLFATTQHATGIIRRVMSWQKWDGTFFLMLSLTNSTPWSRVYKYKVGTDSDWIHLTAAEDTTSSEPFDFAVANNHLFMANGTKMWKYDGTTVRKWGIDPPAATPTLANAGSGLTGTYQYVIAWLNNTTGHTSSPSPVASITVTDDAITVSGNTTTDAQVTHVRLYRTAAGGSVLFEHPASPITYATWTGSGYADSTADTSLTTTVAPVDGQNDPPPPAKGLEWYQGRLWVFANDRVYHSGWEEIPLGTSDMPEECFPPSNYFPFGKQVTGVAATGDSDADGNDPSMDGLLAVFTGGAVFNVTGDSLDTFSRGTIGVGIGCRERATITKFKTLTAWLGSANVVYITNGSDIKEISMPIRPDLATVSHPYSWMFAHTNGSDQWLVLGIGTAGISAANPVLVYDLDREVWIPPWNITGTAGGTLETAAGVFRAVLGIAGTTQELLRTTYKDGGAASGTPFAAYCVTSLLDITEDKPDHNGAVVHIGVERNSINNSSVSVLTDEDPASGTYVDLALITGNPVVPHARTQGSALVENHYKTQSGPFARRASVRLDWAAADSNFKNYAIDIAYEVRP